MVWDCFFYGRDKLNNLREVYIYPVFFGDSRSVKVKNDHLQYPYHPCHGYIKTHIWHEYYYGIPWDFPWIPSYYGIWRQMKMNDGVLKKSQLTPWKINGWNLKMMVWFRWFSFLFMGDGCRFQPLIFQGVLGLRGGFPLKSVWSKQPKEKISPRLAADGNTGFGFFDG